MAKRKRVPAVLTCERCGRMFAIRLPLCNCPEGPVIEKWAAENGWKD